MAKAELQLVTKMVICVMKIQLPHLDLFCLLTCFVFSEPTELKNQEQKPDEKSRPGSAVKSARPRTGIVKY